MARHIIHDLRKSRRAKPSDIRFLVTTNTARAVNYRTRPAASSSTILSRNKTDGARRANAFNYSERLPPQQRRAVCRVSKDFRLRHRSFVFRRTRCCSHSPPTTTTISPPIFLPTLSRQNIPTPRTRITNGLPSRRKRKTRTPKFRPARLTFTDWTRNDD